MFAVVLVARIAKLPTISWKVQVRSIENKTGKLIHSNGGTWSLDGNTMTEVVEFDTDNPERVGSSVVFDIELNNDYLKIYFNKNFKNCNLLIILRI